MAETLRENKMGMMKIPTLLFSISLPIIISMVVQALYNVVDSIFVANFDNHAGTGALTLAFPIQNLLLAVSIGLAVGTNALLSRTLGQKRYDKVNIIAGQGFFLMFCGYLLFLIFGLFLVDTFVSISDNGDALLHDYSKQYISIVSIGSIAVFIQILSERFLQATGKSVLSMIVQLAGALTNLILDPILIFGYFGAPEMGVAGAAIATVTGQFVSAILGLILNSKFNKEIKISVRNFIPNLPILKEILVIAIPAVIMQAIGSVTTFCMNIVLGTFGIIEMNAFGIYFKLQTFAFMPLFGLNNGMIPIVAYNYGARKRSRVYEVMKIAVIAEIVYMTVATSVFHIFPDALLGFFNADARLIEIGSSTLRIISVGFITGGFSVVILAVCQALGKSVYSLIVSVCRQLVVIIPLAFLFSLTGDAWYVWWAFPIAELINLPLCIFYIRKSLKFAFPKENETVPEKGVVSL